LCAEQVDTQERLTEEQNQKNKTSKQFMSILATFKLIDICYSTSAMNPHKLRHEWSMTQKASSTEVEQAF